MEAFQILSDPAARARYDARYEAERESRWRIFDQRTTESDIAGDRRIRTAILELLYTARRNDAERPGVGVLDLERLLGCPEQHMNFHIWYLKENGWLERLENGTLAITASGVDRVLDLGGIPSLSALFEGGGAEGTAKVIIKTQVNGGEEKVQEFEVPLRGGVLQLGEDGGSLRDAIRKRVHVLRSGDELLELEGGEAGPMKIQVDGKGSIGWFGTPGGAWTVAPDGKGSFRLFSGDEDSDADDEEDDDEESARDVIIEKLTKDHGHARPGAGGDLDLLRSELDNLRQELQDLREALKRFQSAGGAR
jgi:hypothetical protein